jgi:uncharacterized protein YigA (DUF484 family)
MRATIDMESLIADNEQLRSELQELLQQAHINQSIIERHQAFDLKLIGASEFRELIDVILTVMPGVFSLETVTLSLIDGDYAIQRILRDLQIGVNEFPKLLFLKAPLHFIDEDGPLEDEKPRLGQYVPALHGALFPNYQPVSVAVLPLVRQHRCWAICRWAAPMPSASPAAWPPTSSSAWPLSPPSAWKTSSTTNA